MYGDTAIDAPFFRFMVLKTFGLSVLEVRLDDLPARLYLERCAEVKTNPLEGTWDGVFTMARK